MSLKNRFEALINGRENIPNYMNVSHLQDEYTKLVQGISDTLDQNEGKVLKKVCDNVYLSDKGKSMDDRTVHHKCR